MLQIISPPPPPTLNPLGEGVGVWILLRATEKVASDLGEAVAFPGFFGILYHL